MTLVNFIFVGSMWKSSLKLFRNEHFKVLLCNKALITIDLKLLKSTQNLTSPLSGEKLPIATNIGKGWIAQIRAGVESGQVLEPYWNKWRKLSFESFQYILDNELDHLLQVYFYITFYLVFFAQLLARKMLNLHARKWLLQEFTWFLQN